MIIYAHRGASEYAPENTISAFYLGLMQGANGIETDIQRTADGELVLFHDDTLDRVTDGHGMLRDHTLAELKRIRVYGNSTTDFYDRIPTMREFLERFAQYDIRFAFELKHGGLEADVLKLAKEYHVYDKMTVTSFNFDYIKRIKELDSKARVGWLIVRADSTDIEALKAIGGEEMAPKAEDTGIEEVKELRSAGLGVRAWGIMNLDLMKKMCRVKVDGMTVNFPDRLFQFLNASKI